MTPVAEVRQDARGRVMVRMRGAQASPYVLETAVRMARSFHCELQGLFVEDERLLALATMPFARETFLAGGRTRKLSPDVVRREMRAAAAAMEREFARLIRAKRVRAQFQFRTAAEGAAIPSGIEETGIVAVGAPLALAASDELAELIADSDTVAGIVAVGQNVRRIAGPILVVLSSAVQVEMLIDTAAQIAGESGESIDLLFAVDDTDEADESMRVARALLGAGSGTMMARIESLNPRSLSTLVNRFGSGLVVAGMGGPLAGDATSAARFICAIECPFLMMR